MPDFNFPKLPNIDKNPIKTAGHFIKDALRGIQQAASEIDSAVKGIDSEIRAPIEEPTTPSETKSEGKEESCPVCSDLTDLKEFLGKRKVEKALTELEIGEGNKKDNVQMVRKFIDGEEID